MKNILNNKFVVTLLSIILCVVILYMGYSYRINQKVKFVDLPVASKDIAGKTKITSKLIDTAHVPEQFLSGNYYTLNEVSTLEKNKYVIYNSKIAKGSPFYKELVVDKDQIPDSIYQEVEDGYTLVNYKVNMDSTYANSMTPDSYINIYFKAKDENGKIMFGKFMANVKILAVKDSNGENVFDNNDGEEHKPSYMMFALPEKMHLLFRMATYLDSKFEAEFTLVPVTTEKVEDNAEYVSSEDIQTFIESNVSMINVDEDSN